MSNGRQKVTKKELEGITIYTAAFYLGYNACYKKMIAIAEEIGEESKIAFDRMNETIDSFQPELAESYELVSDEEAAADRQSKTEQKPAQKCKAPTATSAEFEYLETMSVREIVNHVWDTKSVTIACNPKDKRGTIRKAIKALQGIS